MFKQYYLFFFMCCMRAPGLDEHCFKSGAAVSHRLSCSSYGYIVPVALDSASEGSELQDGSVGSSPLLFHGVYSDTDLTFFSEEYSPGRMEVFNDEMVDSQNMILNESSECGGSLRGVASNMIVQSKKYWSFLTQKNKENVDFGKDSDVSLMDLSYALV